MKKLLRGITQKYKPVLISSYKLNIIKDICDEIIYKGSNLFLGSVGDLREQFELSYEETKNISLEELFVKMIDKENYKIITWI